MRARRIMSTTLLLVERSTPVREVIRLLIDQRISAVPGWTTARRSGSSVKVTLSCASERIGSVVAWPSSPSSCSRIMRSRPWSTAKRTASLLRMSDDRAGRHGAARYPAEEIAHMMAERQIKRFPVVENDSWWGSSAEEMSCAPPMSASWPSKRIRTAGPRPIRRS